MKKLLIYGLLLVVFFVNMGAGCGSQTNDLLPDSFLGIVGKWKLTKTGYYLTKSDDQSGDLTLQISTAPNFMALVVDVTKLSTYKEMTLMQNFKKL